MEKWSSESGGRSEFDRGASESGQEVRKTGTWRKSRAGKNPDRETESCSDPLPQALPTVPILLQG